MAVYLFIPCLSCNEPTSKVTTGPEVFRRFTLGGKEGGRREGGRRERGREGRREEGGREER